MVAKVTKLFPGGNTGYGFHSFYDYIAPGAKQIYVLKGGPGVGKSTFMRWIGQEMLKRDFDIEEHYCSSDPNSLDGIAVPALGVAILDGTAPHVVDPKQPGVVDTIIHLGDHWQDTDIKEYHEQIVEFSRHKSLCFRRAYAYLKAAKHYNDEMEHYVTELGALDVVSLNRLANEVVSRLFDCVRIKRVVARERHLFVSAITPVGFVNHLDTVLDELEWRVLLQGRPGSGRTTLVDKVRRAAVERGYNVDVYHCALDPARIDHVVIPELSVAIVNASQPHVYQPKEGDMLIDTNEYLAWERLAAYDDDLCRLNQLHHQALGSAISFIARAKRNHSKLEAFYVPAMDFDAISRRREQTLSQILDKA